MPGFPESGFFLIPIVALVSVFSWLIVQSIMRARLRELEIRERIAMIERGLVPPPEVDPARFDDELERQKAGRQPRPGRHQRAGISLIGIGVGMLALLFPNFRVGFFLIALGVAFLVTGLLERDRVPLAPPRPRQLPESGPREQP